LLFNSGGNASLPVAYWFAVTDSVYNLNNQLNMFGCYPLNPLDDRLEQANVSAQSGLLIA
jgi:hypothetical protein